MEIRPKTELPVCAGPIQAKQMIPVREGSSLCLARFGFSSSGLADDFTYNGIAMSTTLPPVHPIELSDIQAARERIAGTIVRTPLVRLELGTEYPDIRLKLENLQPINAYKLRGAVNAVAMLPESERTRGVWTISAGNAGQGVAYAARQAGVPCSVVAIETAPEGEGRADASARGETDPGPVPCRVEGAG